MRRYKRTSGPPAHAVISLSVACLLPGCVSGSLASNTGPRASGARWSTAPQQSVHVGETVHFDFVLVNPLTGKMIDPMWHADYCVAAIGSDRIQIEPDALGHFPFEYTFDQILPQQQVTVSVTAYFERGYRDFMNIGGRWVQTDSPTDMPDKLVAADSIEMAAYELTIEMQVQAPGAILDPETGVLRIFRSDGSPFVRYIDRPHRPGFTLGVPDPQGNYRVRYTLRGDEVNAEGTTLVEFEIHNLSGEAFKARSTFETP